MIRLAAFACLVGLAQAQSFEVVSIKPAGPPGPNNSRRVSASSPDPGRWVAENMSLANLVHMGYKLRGYEYSGPDWLQTEMFDINAKIPEGATKDQIPDMVRSMLEERFHLKFHREKREIVAYNLVAAKGGVRMKEHVNTAMPAADAPRVPGPLKLDKDGYPDLAGRTASMAMMNGRARAIQTNVGMARIVQLLEGQMGKPVTDATGLTGKYDFTLSWATDTRMRAAPPGADLPEDTGPTLEQAIQDQLGLKLEQRKTSVDVLVVDSIEKRPTEN